MIYSLFHGTHAVWPQPVGRTVFRLSSDSIDISPIDPSPNTKSATQKTPQKTPLHTTRDFLSRDILTFSCYAPPSTDLSSTTPISAFKRDDRLSHLPSPFSPHSAPPFSKHRARPNTRNSPSKTPRHALSRHVLTFLSHCRHLPSFRSSTPISPFKPMTIPSPPPPFCAHFTSPQLNESAVKNYAIKTIMNKKKIRV